MKNARVARRYAVALMTVAEETGTLDAMTKDLNLIRQALVDSRELRTLLQSPVVSSAKKRDILKDIFSNRVDKGTMAFMNLMTAKGREAILADVVHEFHLLRDERLRIVSVDVRAAVELSQPQEQSLQQQLERYTGKKVRVRFSLDKAIQGGVVIKIGDTILDASIRRQLELLRERLSAGSPLLN